jgi:hypothetical protein
MRLIFTYRPYNLFSWLVRKLTGQRYSHVAVQMHDGLVYEAVLGGCRRQRLHDFLKHNHVEAVVYTEDATPLMHSRAVSKLGATYDVPALIWFLFYLWATKRGWEVPRITINPKWLLCSEYVYYILTGDTQTVTPEDVYNMAETTP